MRLHYSVLLVLLVFGLLHQADAEEIPPSTVWNIAVSDALVADEAVRLAVEDLQSAAPLMKTTFVRVSDEVLPSGPAILVGTPERNRLTAQLGSVTIEGVLNPEGYEIRSTNLDGARVIVVAGGSSAGDANGLYWLWDRIRVFRRIPEIDVRREPALQVRAAGGLSKDEMRSGLRYSINWVTGAENNRLVPWDTEPERTSNEKYRAETQELIEYAHALHMKFFSRSDEITYLPEHLKSFGATLSPDDPALWDALQDKYRRLLRAMPDLDGIRIRTGELTWTYDNYQPFDIMHEPKDNSMPLDERYRTFLQKMHAVVVGEFGKIYYHRTWVANATEQHSDPDAYKAIFTDAVPTENLYLSPYLTLADRWFYQPYNPTFNLTPHKMLVLLATMDYHAHQGVAIFPTYCGPYMSEGLRRILIEPEESNVAGTQLGIPGDEGWYSGQLTAYTIYRMAWDAAEDPLVIARDFAAIHFGPEAAEDVGQAILLSQSAYENGMYIKPVAEGIRGNTLPQLRLTSFPARGFPEVDQGRPHMEWLHDAIYLPCAQRKQETLDALDAGLATARRISSLVARALPSIEDQAQAVRLAEATELMRLLIETNNRYVKTCFAYFGYRDAPDNPTRKDLADALTSLVTVVSDFEAAPGFVYQLYGIDVLIDAAGTLLDNRDRAMQVLASAPDDAQALENIADLQERHRLALERHGDRAVKLLHWQGRVDGKDVLHIRGRDIEVEHIAADEMHSIEAEFAAELPGRPGTVLLKPIQSAEIHPFVLEQPKEANGYTARIYLFDPGPGYNLWEFELYYLEDSPRALDLVAPWSH